jgi:uncharacterized membrane protein
VKLPLPGREWSGEGQNPSGLCPSPMLPPGYGNGSRARPGTLNNRFFRHHGGAVQPARRGDGDGFNDLLVALEAPGAGVGVDDLNNLGQVVGRSAGHAVRWELVDGVQIVTDFGSLANRLNMFATGINDSGRIVGSSRQHAGRITKTGPAWLIDNDTLYELLP